VQAACGQALDGRDGTFADLGDRRHTCAHGISVQQHGARPARTFPAPVLRARQVEFFAEDVQQATVRPG
jgi:hypothetical protein